MRAYIKVQELFSRKGLILWLENPTRRQSSCSCSAMNLMMPATASDTGVLLIAASRRSCSVTALCCCNVDTTMSINAVSERPMLNNLLRLWRTNCTGHTGRGWLKGFALKHCYNSSAFKSYCFEFFKRYNSNLNIYVNEYFSFIVWRMSTQLIDLWELIYRVKG